MYWIKFHRISIPHSQLFPTFYCVIEIPAATAGVKFFFIRPWEKLLHFVNAVIFVEFIYLHDTGVTYPVHIYIYGFNRFGKLHYYFACGVIFALNAVILYCDTHRSQYRQRRKYNIDIAYHKP